MRLTFLGTSAPEGNPSPFCECENCNYVRIHKGKNVRIGASLLINDDLLIDFGPDVTRSFNNLGLSMNSVKYCLVTHCHFDHFYPGNIFNRRIGPRTTEINELTIYGPERMHDRVKGWLFENGEQKVFLNTIKPFQELNIGKYTVKTLKITQSDEFAGKGMFFIITDEIKTILYAVDTYRFPEENWNEMKKFSFDTIILDETFGYKKPPNKDHHNIELYLETMNRFKKEELTKENTKYFTQHMSHHNPPHDRLLEIMKKHGVIVPHDGFVVKI